MTYLWIALCNLSLALCATPRCGHSLSWQFLSYLQLHPYFLNQETDDNLPDNIPIPGCVHPGWMGIGAT